MFACSKNRKHVCTHSDHACILGSSAVEKVIYPGLESHPQRELARAQMSMPSGMVSRSHQSPTNLFASHEVDCAATTNGMARQTNGMNSLRTNSVSELSSFFQVSSQGLS